MSTPTERIVKLVPQLPAKDIPIAERLIKGRDFCSLKELVDSAIYKVKKSHTHNLSMVILIPPRYFCMNYVFSEANNPKYLRLHKKKHTASFYFWIQFCTTAPGVCN